MSKATNDQLEFLMRFATKLPPYAVTLVTASTNDSEIPLINSLSTFAKELIDSGFVAELSTCAESWLTESANLSGIPHIISLSVCTEQLIISSFVAEVSCHD